MDIKELALKVAGMDELMGPRDTFAFTKERMADFATRLIAAYTEGQEPVAYKYISTTYPDRFYQISELTPEYFSRENWTPVPLYAAPPEPAPSEFSAEQRDKDWSAIKSTAPSSEEVRDAVARLNDRFYDLDEGDCRRISDLIERLAARVPDGCVVVPREPTEAMCQYLCDCDDRHSELKGASAIYKAMIAAGEVKP